MYTLNPKSKKLLNSFFRTILIKSLDEFQLPMSVVNERIEFFKKQWALESERLGKSKADKIELLAEASLIVEWYGHLRFGIESTTWEGQVAEYGGIVGVSETEDIVFKQLSYEELREYKDKQEGISNFMQEFEFAVPPPAMIKDEKTGEYVEYLRDISDLEIEIKVGKIRFGLPKQLNQQLVTHLFEMLGDFSLYAIPRELNVKVGKKPSLYAFFSKTLMELLPFIELVILEDDKSPSNSRFISGTVFVSFNQMVARDDYEHPRSKYKKGRGTSTIDYYSYVAKTIRNYSTR